MKTKKVFAGLFVLIGLTTLQVNGQQGKMKTFKGDHCSLKYPAQWQTSSKDGSWNFFPPEGYGVLTVSYHSEIDFPLERTKKFILDMNEIKENPKNVKMTRKGDITEFYYEQVDKGIKWIIKAYRKKASLYLLTINCEAKKWNAGKNAFMSILTSFKMN